MNRINIDTAMQGNVGHTMLRIHYELSDRSALEARKDTISAALERKKIYHWVRWQPFGSGADSGFRLTGFSDPQLCILELFPSDLLLPDSELEKLIVEGQRSCSHFVNDQSGTQIKVFDEPCRVYFGPNSKAKKTKPYMAWGNYRTHHINEAATSISKALQRWEEVARMYADT